MRAFSVFLNLFLFFLPPAVICTIGLYLYPFLFDCNFPVVQPAVAACFIPGQERPAIAEQKAPFRLLTFADPQLEGDTSLPDPDAPFFPSLWKFGRRVRRDGVRTLWTHLSSAGGELWAEDLPGIFQGYRKQLDLWGNDLYLAHIYRLVSWWSQPTHVVVLGDLLGSQHIGDEEFRHRSARLWHTVFPGLEKVGRTVTDVSGRTEVLGEDLSWSKRLIAVAGNHDIGYAGDIDEHRIARFEEMYGSVNWAIRFKLENTTSSTGKSSKFSLSPLSSLAPELRLIVLNSMNLDGPARKPELQDQSRDFLTHELYAPTKPTTSTTGTILLTHIPFYKEAGVCADRPLFEYFPKREDGDGSGGIKEQNHLSQPSTDYILHGLAGVDTPGTAIVLNGHDHVGCDTYHYRSISDTTTTDPSSSDEETGATSPWHAKSRRRAYAELHNETLTGLREITVRSMMGSYNGNAGLLSAWFDEEIKEWKFEYRSCSAGVQHIWWGIHALDAVVAALGLAMLLTGLWEDLEARTEYVVRVEGPKIKGE